MINLAFVAGSSLRRVIIDERKITMMSPETKFVPMVMDLDKINEKEIIKKMGKDGLKFMKEISKLETEEDMAQDVIKDFQRTGWRRIKKQ